MKIRLIAFLLLINCYSYCQSVNLDAKIDEQNYFIKYPKNWKIDNTGKNGSSFYLFAEKDSPEDNFGENINLMIQNLQSMNLNIDKYTEISENQIKANGNLIESKRIKRNGLDCQQIIYEAIYKDFQMKFRQYYFIKDEKAYILTFSATDKTYDRYIELAEKIMLTFKIK